MCVCVHLLHSRILEVQDFTNRLTDKARAYGMEVSTEKGNIMTNSTNNISADSSIKGQNQTHTHTEQKKREQERKSSRDRKREYPLCKPYSLV